MAAYHDLVKNINSSPDIESNFSNVLNVVNNLQEDKLKLINENIKNIDNTISTENKKFNIYYRKKHLYRLITEIFVYFFIGCIIICCLVFIISNIWRRAGPTNTRPNYI